MSNKNKVTKKEQVKKLFDKYRKSKTRAEMVEIITEKVKIPEGSARTQLSILMKNHALSNNQPYPQRKIKKYKHKKYIAMSIFSNNPTLDRENMIKVFMDKLNMSYNSAATHCSMCSKQFIEANPTNTSHNAVVYPRTS